jgi:DNA repair protein SbcD/Mre11
VMGAEHTWYEAYAARLEQILTFLTKGLRKDTINIALAHLMVAGARVGAGERPMHLGDTYGLNAQQLPDTVQYIALGHLHRPQEILAPARTAYAGSLLELDFGEREQEKRVVLVEAAPGKAARLESIPITAGRRLLDIEGGFDDVLAQGRTLADAFLRVTVRTVGPEPGIAERVREHLPQAIDVRALYEQAPDEARPVRLAGLTPTELFAEFHRSRFKAEPTAEVVQLFREIHDEAVQEGR